MSDGLHVGSGNVEEPVRKVRQGAGDRDFLTDLRDLLVGRVAACLAATGQVSAAAHDQAGFGLSLVIVPRRSEQALVAILPPDQVGVARLPGRGLLRQFPRDQHRQHEVP